MKIFTHTLLILVNLFCLNALWAGTYQGPTKLLFRIEDNITVNGPATFNHVKTNVLIVNGNLNFDHLKVSGTAQLNGPVEGKFGDFGSCDIKGPAQLSDILAKNLSIMGALQVNRLKVSDVLTVAGALSLQNAEVGTLIITPDNGSKILLDATHVKNVVVKGKNKDEVLKLMNNSIVEGTVKFESGSGKIETDQSSKVMGSVSGAKK